MIKYLVFVNFIKCLFDLQAGNIKKFKSYSFYGKPDAYYATGSLNSNILKENKTNEIMLTFNTKQLIYFPN